MPERVFVIAECGSCWRFGDDHLANAYRMISAAKECGADAVKFQWTSDCAFMMERRKAKLSEGEAYKCVEWPREWLTLFKAKCDSVGIEFMCTVFLPQDVAVIAPLVKRFKVAAKESMDREFLEFHYPYKKQIILSHNAHGPLYTGDDELTLPIYCVSRYPTPIEDLKLGRMWFEPTQGRGHYQIYYGLSDHTGHVLTGAVAVGAGARVIESHVRLGDTPESNPDYPHSLQLPTDRYNFGGFYDEYVSNIRTAERML